MKRLLSIITIAALIASPAFTQETKMKKLEKLEKGEKIEKTVVVDSLAVKDTTAIEFGDEVFSVKEIGNETKIKFGKKEIRIVEDDDGVVVYKNYSIDGDNYKDGDIFTLHKKDPDRFRGHLGGIGFAFNGLMTDFLETSLAPEDSYFDLNTAKSFNWSFVFPAVNLGFTRHFGLSSELGMTFSKYRFDGNNTIVKGDGGVVEPYYPGDGIVYSKSKLATTYATLPVILEWQIPVSGLHTINIGAGVVGAVKLGSKTKVVYHDDGKEKYKNKDDFSLNLLRWGTTARIGYDSFQIYGTYYFTEMFEKGKGPLLYPYEIGISFRIND